MIHPQTKPSLNDPAEQAISALPPDEKLYLTLVNSIGGIVWEANAETFQFTFVSPQAEKILGYPIEQWLSDPGFWRDHIHRDDREWCVAFCVDATTNRRDHEFQYRMIAADGRVIWLHDIVSVNVEPNGSVRLRGIMIDITDRKSADEALRASEERFSKTFDLSPLRMGVVRIKDGKVLDVNIRWLRDMGFTREEVIGQSIFELTRWLDEEEHSPALALLKKGEPFRDVEFCVKTASGDRRTVMVSGEVIELGGEPCLLMAANDVTERTRAEEALRRNEELFRAIVEDQTEMIVRWKPDSTRTFVNQAYCRAFGGTPESFIGKSFFPLIVEEFRESIREKIRSLTPDNPTATESHQSTTPSGEECWQEWTDRGIFDAEGRLVELQSTGRDITERKHNEEALRASEQRFSIAFNASPLPLTISRLEDGCFLAVNDRFVDITGYSRAEILGKTALELGLWPNPEDRVKLMEQLKQDGRIREAEASMRTKSGAERVLTLSIETIELEGKQCLLHAVNDITERKQAEEQLRNARDQLRALTARVRSTREEEGVRIAREIHDELGSALTSLRWDLEAMEKKLGQSENGTSMFEQREKLSAMTRLVDTTINVVRRISADLRPGVLDDLGLVAAIEWQAQQFEVRTGIVCECDCPIEEPQLNQDQTVAVFRILQEVLTNVLRHAQASRVEIEIKTPDDEFILTIKDNGRGITEIELLSPHSLGLLGMSERAQLIGGKVCISGGESDGTTVTVRVPLISKSRVGKSDENSAG